MPGFPHELVVEFDGTRKLAGFTALPRQDDNQNGWIKDYAFYASADGKAWGDPVAKGVFVQDAKLKTVKFAAPVTAKFVKLVALSGYADGPWASLAEFNVIDAGAELAPDQIKGLAVAPAGTSKLQGVRSIKADSVEDGYEVENAIDGDPETMWHTSWEGDMPGFPHELVVEFDGDRKLAGFTALPRQDDNQNGWIKDYAFYVSADGKTWGDPVAKGVFVRDAKLKTVKFAAPVTAKFVKLVALSGYADGPWASLAEFNVVDAE